LAPKLHFAIPGDIATKTGGYGYDRRLIEELHKAGWVVTHLAWGDSFPFASSWDLAAAGRSLACLADGDVVLIDGLAFGAIPEIAEAESGRLRLVALVHHPLADETGLSQEQRELLWSSESRALAMTRAVIATSNTTAERLVRGYGVAREKIAVARPGSDPVPTTDRLASSRAVLRLLSVGTVTHRKGPDVLIEALALTSDLAWTCGIAGAIDRAPEFTARILRLITGHGFDRRVHLLGPVSDLGALYESADIFVLASRNEGYGMVFSEAMQHGLPIVATTAGAVPESVPPAAGLLVTPDNPRALASALRRLISDSGERRRYAAGARAAAASLPLWQDTGRCVAEALVRVASS
jgi:glycosyltransferase involved in cell wall biosynthesis